MFSVQCADIQSDSLPNGMVTLMERHVGSTANFSCNEGYLLDGNHSITCTQSGWNGETPQCRCKTNIIPHTSFFPHIDVEICNKQNPKQYDVMKIHQ